jgi:hypothetical protein
MPDVVESEAVQIRRIVADERKAIAQVVANVLLAATTAVGAYFMARLDSKVEQVEQRVNATGAAVQDLKANARVMYYGPPPEAKKE